MGNFKAGYEDGPGACLESFRWSVTFMKAGGANTAGCFDWNCRSCSEQGLGAAHRGWALHPQSHFTELGAPSGSSHDAWRHPDHGEHPAVPSFKSAGSVHHAFL